MGALAGKIPAGTLSDVSRTLSGGGSWYGEFVHRGDDGAVRVSEASISPILETDGRVVGSITVGRDVTERREQARERDRLVSATEQSGDGIVITDPDFRVVYANKVFADTVGQDPAELLGRTAAEVAGIGLDPNILADMARTVQAGRPWIAEVDHPNPDETVRRLEATVRPTRDASGEISGWVGVMRDITERVAADVALRASEARLRTVLDTMAEGVAVMSSVRDANGAIVDFRIEYANASIGDISRVAPARQVGHTVLDLFPAHRTSGLFDAYVAVVETGEPFESGPVHYVDPDAAGGALDQIAEHRAARLGDGYRPVGPGRHRAPSRRPPDAAAGVCHRADGRRGRHHRQGCAHRVRQPGLRAGDRVFAGRGPRAESADPQERRPGSDVLQGDVGGAHRAASRSRRT